MAMKLVFCALDRRCVALSRFPTKYICCARLICTRPFATDTSEFSQGMMSLEHPLGAAMLSAVAGKPVRLSRTQNDWIYGCSSARGVTNEIFMPVMDGCECVVRGERIRAKRGESRATPEALAPSTPLPHRAAQPWRPF